MLEALTKLYAETLGLSSEVWMIISVCIVVVAFAVPLIAGLVAGRLKAVKAVMKSAIAHPQTAVAAMKKMPSAIKTQYKNARIGNLRPSMLVTEQVCVAEPYKRSLISKVWISTLAATLICAEIAGVSSLVASDGPLGVATAPLTVCIFGGLLTLIGGIVGKCVYGGAVKTYEKFIPVLDGEQTKGAEPAAAQAEQQPVYSEQPAYAEPQTAYAEAQPVYAEQQQAAYAEPAYAEQQQQPYAEAQPVYEEQPQVVNVAPQESEEEIRRKAREDALAQARAQQQQQQQQAQAQQAAAQAQSATAQQQAALTGGSSADDVIAQIEKIDRDGAPRETMREVATLLQRERAKPENKTPEQQKKLNEALSKLLKAMSAASRK